jgi:hypothetical protein
MLQTRNGGQGARGEIRITYSVIPVIFSFLPTEVCENTGTTIVLDGCFFTGTTNVSLNAVAAAFNVINDNELEITLPALATPGDYTISVTNAAGTGFSADLITVHPEFTSTASTDNDVSCFGGSDGNATATEIGGTAPFEYIWSDGQTTSTASGLTEGIYTVTLSDDNNCTFENTVTITEPTAITVTPSITSNYNGEDISCFGSSDGEATVLATGGTGTDYSYLWSDADNQTTTSATGLIAGTFFISVEDENNCLQVESITVTQPDELNPNIVLSDFNGFQISCFGQTDGEIQLTPSGGVAPYTFLWNADANNETTATVTGLAEGLNYTVTITDDNGCENISTITITEPLLLTSTITDFINACSGSTTGEATVTVVGGATPYSFLWDDTANQTSPTATGLDANEYQVTVTDANGCESTASVTITDQAALTANATTDNDASCGGYADGEGTITPVGGGTSFSYFWPISADNQTTATATGLTAGTYTITVIDNNNCFAEASITVTEPDPVVPTLTITSSYNGSEISCLGASDGIATTNPIGGTGTYTSYFWSANAQTTASASGLAAGVYNITVTDSDNCEGYESITVTSPSSIDVNINITSNYNGEDISCFGGNDGTANAIPSGGTGAYSYLWSFAGQTSATATGLNAGIHSVTVYDANSCESVESITLTQPSNVTTTTTVSSNYNGQNISCNGENDGEATTTPSGGTGAFSYLWSAGAQTTQTATGLSVGVFTVTIEDDNGCLTSSSITLTQPSNITTTASVSSNYNGEDISCNGESDGQATATPSGGTGAFSYLWSASAQTTQTATGLSAGTYTVTATDLNGCSSTASTTITEPTIVDVSAAVTSNYNGTQISCNGASDGVITATPSGGVTPYTYLWNDAANQVTNSATGLPVGTFNVTIFDANGCSANDNATLSQPTAVTVSAVITSNYNGAQISCNGLSNGTASATPSNGTPSYTYLWSVNAQTTATATGLNAGVHTVTVFDSNNCSATASVTATQPTAVTVTSSVTSSYGGGVETTCSYSSDGEVLAAGSGGTGAFSYVWNDAAAQTTAAATGLPSGTYQVTATDANGCQNTSSVSITPAPVIVTNPSQTNVTLFGGQDGEAAVSPTGGVGAFTFLWDNEITNSLVPPDFTGSTITGLKADVFNVTITDNNGCNAFESITITQADSLQGGEITIIGAVDGIYNVCKNNNTAPDYLNSIAPYGGTPPFTYTWQYSTNFTSWTNYPASNSIDFSSGATITQTTVVRRRVLDAAGATAYSSYLLLYLADTTTTVSLLEPTYCLNDSSEHTLSVIPSNATSTWTLRDLDVVSPAPDELLATNPNGTAFFIPSSVSDSGNYVMIHTYENDNGCTSTLSIPVFMHTFTDATFNLDPIYNSNITSVPLNEITIVNPTGGEFAGPGVSSFDKVFSPSIAGAGIHVLTYTYTDPNSGCVDVTKDSTQVIIAEGNFVGLPAGNWFCVNSVRDTLRADVGVNGIVGSATFSITPIVPYPNIPQLIDTDNAGVDSVIIRPNFAPAGGGEYILSFTYISNQDSVTELSVSEFIKFADFSNIDLIASASANLRYCEADPIDTITAIFSYPNGGNVGAGTYSGSLLISDIVSLPGSAEIDPNMPASNIINYTYTDPISGCVANINRNLFVNALPILEITSLNPNNSYCIDESPQTLNTNILGGNFTTGSGVSAGTSFIQSVCIFDVPGGNGNCNFTNDLCYDGYQYIYAGNNINSDPFTIGSEKLINDITLSIYYTNCSGISSSFQVFLNGNLISTNPVLDFSCSCIPSNGYPQTFVIPGNSINPFWNFGGNNIITVRNANVDIYYAGISANVSYTGGFVFNPSVATAGNHTITYTYSDENGCTSQVDSSVVVHELPVVNFTIKSLYNIEEATDTLYGTPWGGTFSGNSIVDTVFYPPTAGIGIHPITYNYTETVTGCSNFITIQTEVQEASGYFDGLIPIYCTAGSEDTLWTVVSNSNGNPGIYSITGNNGLNDLLNDSAEFVPSLVTAGFYTISYTYLGFDDFTTFTIDTLIEVIDLGSANILGLEDGYCVDAEIDSLFGIPNSFGNGQFTSVLGLNVALGDTALFNPSVAGVGLHNIHFVFTDVVSGCIIDTTMVTEVYDLPTPSFTLNPIYNIVGSNQTLVGTPSGGTFSGDGMTGDTFSPADAGLGIASVTYTYTDANACTNFVTEITDVQEAAGTFFGIPANNYFCIDGDDTEIWAIPDNGDGSIGTYTGTAITDLANDTALFSPSMLNDGSFVITYTYFGSDGTTPFSIDTTVYVRDLGIAEIISLEVGYCVDADVDSIFGIPSIAGIGQFTSMLSLDVSLGDTALFNPSIAGVGFHQIEYTFTEFLSGCAIDTIVETEVYNLPTPSFTLNPIYNIVGSNQTLVGTPSGGTFSGDGMTGDNFSPADAGLGIASVTYTYTDANACTNFVTEITDVQEAAGTFFGIPANNYFCIDGDDTEIWAIPDNGDGSIGTYTGTAITDLANDTALFSPSMLNDGSFVITYTYFGSDGTTPFSIDTTVYVRDLGIAEIISLEVGYCVDADVDSIFGIPSIAGIGQFTSMLSLDVSLGDTALFNPSIAGVGFHQIEYTFTEFLSGCAIDTIVETEVYNLPTPSFTLNPIYNIVGSNQTLVGTPSGGTFSGDGMTGDTFSPADAGLGIASVTYTYTDANACTNFVTEITDVQEAAGTFFGIPANNYFCIDGDDTEIWAIPDNGDGSIGTYTGTAITDLANDTALFASNTLTIGSYIITYTYKGIDGVTSFQIDTTVYVSGITSIEINEPNTMFCINDDPFDFSGSPAGGTFSSPNAGLSGSTFTPSIAGLGLKTITYLYTDPVSLCSREISRDLTVNGLPDIGIASNFANSYCLNADTIQVQGLINLAPAGIGTFYGNAIVESLNNGTGKYVAGDVGVPLENIVDTIWFNYIDPSTGCENTVFRSTVVRSLPEPRIQGLNEEKMYCQNFGTVFLGGSDSLGNPGSGSWVINNNPATSQFNTNTLPDTLVSIAFTWSITGFGCSNTFFDTIRIASVPVASFVVGNNCMTHPTEFFSTSTVNNVLGDYIESWFWNFGDLSFGNSNDTSSLENPIYQYSVPAEYTINLEVTTNNGCVGVVPAIDRRVRFGTSPPVNYTWLNECYPGENTVFSSDDETNNFPGVKTYIWKFGDGNSISADNLIETNHHYQDTGSYVTQLIIDTDNGCIDSISKIINIRSVYTPSRFSAYKTDFESGKDGWLSENKENSLNSWAFGTPNKEIINSANSGIKTWITNLDTNYYDNEKSWISSPCFNLSELQRPMIKLWINSSMPNNDGLVLQYSVDAGISWKNVGTTNSGINWYNTSGIEGNPGEQTVLSGFSGWSGTTEGWIECRNNLDSLIGQNNVRFRLAFGSNGIQNGEGIAFDDIWIGERSRVALIENFTNSNSTQAVDAENLINKIADENPLDVLAIQYHTSFPGVDEFNQTNPADPSARGLYYGVNSVPYAALDGNQFNGSNLTKKEIDMRVLQDPQFDIYLSSEFTSSNTIDINSTITCKSAIGQTEVSLQLAIIEKIVGTNKYVLREMIPDASGFVFKQSWQPGYQQSVNVSHTIKNIENIDNFRLIAFVQDNNSKEVYQATYNDSALFSTSLKEIEFSDILDFNMYPNPTNQFVNIQLIGNDNVHSSIQIYDQLGKLAYQTTVDKYDTFIQIELNALQNGLYFVQLKNEKNQSSIKKLMIVK